MKTDKKKFLLSEIIPYGLRPALAYASGAFLASFIFSLSVSILFSALLFFAFAIFAKLFLRRHFFCFLASFMAISFSGYFFLREAEKYSKLPDNFAVIAELEAQDFSLPGEELSWMNMPYYSQARLKTLRFSQYDKNPKLADCKVAVVLRSKKIKFSYGDNLRIKGYLCKPANALFEGDFSQKDFFLSRKTIFLLYADELEVISHGEDPVSEFVRWRNKLLSRICDGLSDGNKEIIAALVFGCRQGIDPLSRQKLAMSGTVHVIAISGIHTAIFAFIALSFMCFFPFRIRYLLLPLILFFYVFSTGFQPSALRAFLMIAIWSLLKSSLYPTSGFVSLLYAATLSLFINPFSLLDTGFQYSFLITAFLIGGWRRASAFISVLDFSSRFRVGIVQHSWSKNFVYSLISGSIMCVIALFAGLQISLFNQNIFNPLSTLVNLLVTPFLYFIFVLSFFKIFFDIAIFASVLDWLLTTFRIVIVSFSDSALRIAMPPFIPFIIFFSIPFTGIIFFKLNKKALIACTVSAFICISALFILPGISGNKTYIISGGGRPPSLLAIRPDCDRVFLVNAPSREHSRKIIELLSANGISLIDKVYCTDAVIKYLEGVTYLFSYFDCANLVFVSNPSLSPYAKIAARKGCENGSKIHILSDLVRKREKKIPSIEKKTIIIFPENEILTFYESKQGGGYYRIKKEEKETNFTFDNHLKLKLIK